MRLGLAERIGIPTPGGTRQIFNYAKYLYIMRLFYNVTENCHSDQAANQPTICDTQPPEADALAAQKQIPQS